MLPLRVTRAARPVNRARALCTAPLCSHAIFTLTFVFTNTHDPRYIMFWPNTTRNKMAAWAGNQGADGMLAEQIHNANPDQPEGRIMADSTSMFICYVLELLRWSADKTTLDLCVDLPTPLIVKQRRSRDECV